MSLTAIVIVDPVPPLVTTHVLTHDLNTKTVRDTFQIRHQPVQYRPWWFYYHTTHAFRCTPSYYGVL